MEKWIHILSRYVSYVSCEAFTKCFQGGFHSSKWHEVTKGQGATALIIRASNPIHENCILSQFGSSMAAFLSLECSASDGQKPLFKL